jgi:hypothetical protein
MRTAVLILFGVLPLAAAEPTYSREVSRIMQAKCQRCHRPNDIAPFPLTNHAEARVFLEDIGRAVEHRHMPPWKPVAGHGEFRDNFSLTDEERQTMLAWVNAGGPEGDPAELPEPLPETGEWILGEPDKVVAMAEEFSAPPGRDTYRCFVIPPGLDEDRYLTAIQVLPGNRRIVHHVILFLDSTGQAERFGAAAEGPGYECFGGPGTPLSLDTVAAGWVPGMRTQPLPDGVGILIPKNARIVMQVHYHGGSQGGTDITRAGLYFSKQRIDRRLFYVPLVNTRFEIPPDEKDHEVTAEIPILPLLDAKLIQIAPHMHLLGKQIKVEVERRGEKQSLIYIDDWDFHWQGFYSYQNEVPLRSGSTLKLTCTFNNNTGKKVRWGEGTEDEMCLAFLGVTFDNGRLLGLQ